MDGLDKATAELETEGQSAGQILSFLYRIKPGSAS